MDMLSNLLEVATQELDDHGKGGRNLRKSEVRRCRHSKEGVTLSWPNSFSLSLHDILYPTIYPQKTESLGKRIEVLKSQLGKMGNRMMLLR
jgi:hypothetical protein